MIYEAIADKRNQRASRLGIPSGAIVVVFEIVGLPGMPVVRYEEAPLITRFSADFVLGHEDGHHALFREGQVVYEDDRIVFVGRDYPGTVDESYDLGASLITPGSSIWTP